MAFLAFTFSLIIGLWVNNPFTTVVGRALIVLVVFYILGYVLSVLGQRVIQENFDDQIENAKAAASSHAENTHRTDTDDVTDVSSQTPMETAPTPVTN